MKIKLADLLKPIDATCAKCNGRMIIYPDPLPRGAGVCLNGCTPAWFVDFSAWRHAHRDAFYDASGRRRSDAEAERRLDAAVRP